MVVLPLVAVLLGFQNPNLLVNGDFQAGTDSWSFVGGAVADEGARKLARFNITTKPANPWDIGLRQALTEELPKGASVTISFEAKSKSTSTVSAMVERATSPYDKIIQKDFTLTPKWSRYELKGTIGETLPAGTSQFVMHLGSSVGEIDITNVNLFSPQVKTTRISYPVKMLKNSNFTLGLQPWFTEGKNAPKIEIAEGNVGGQSKVLKVDLNSVEQDPWNCQVGQLIEPNSVKGDVVYLRAWLRRTTAKPIAVSLVYEMNVAPHEKDLYETVTPTNQWQEYKIAVPNTRSYAEKSSQFKLFFIGKGTVEVGPISLTNLGKADISKLETFAGALQYEADEEWKKQANERINKLRKGSLVLTVLDSKGKPVKAGTTVSLKQTSSAFRFGTALPASRLLEQSEDGTKFRDVVKRLFNTVTYENDLKWNGASPDIFPTLIDPATDWLTKNGIRLRGHNLVWGSYRNLPALPQTLNAAETWKVVQEHVKDYATRMKGRVYLWDVVNEAVTETELWDKIGWDKFALVYKMTSQIDPKAELCYNDFNINTNDKHRATAISRVKMLQRAGAKVTVFGDQSHLSAPGVAPKRLWEVWDEVYRETKIPIEVTELDFSTRDDNFQAAYIEDFYRAAFSHPNVDGVILWGFWEKSHWLANRGGHMINADWTWRPAMKSVERLITKEWRTNVTLKTNSKGQLIVPAFFGSYEANINGSKFIFNHSKTKLSETVRLKQ